MRRLLALPMNFAALPVRTNSMHSLRYGFTLVPISVTACACVRASERGCASGLCVHAHERVRAVSHEVQYFDFIYCKELHENKDAIGQRVLDFFYSVNKRIPHESYVRHIGCDIHRRQSHCAGAAHCAQVIDFLVLQDRILIIELNPFHNGAGASLFSWGVRHTPPRACATHVPTEGQRALP